MVFADDNNTLSIGDRVKDRNVTVVSYGLDEKSDIRGQNYQNVYEGGVPVGFSFDIVSEGNTTAVRIKGIIGATYMYPLLAAVAVGKVRGIESTSIAKSLAAFDAPKGRMNILAGINQSTIIDDSYNSSPDAAQAALSVMKSLDVSGSKIAVLGDMMELGKFSAQEHRRIGKEVFGSVDRLVTVGQRSRASAEEAISAGMPGEMVRSFDSSEEAATHLASIVKSGDIILVKGSQSVRTERIVAALLREPEKAAKLLVRQEKEWLEKR